MPAWHIDVVGSLITSTKISTRVCFPNDNAITMNGSVYLITMCLQCFLSVLVTYRELQAYRILLKDYAHLLVYKADAVEEYIAIDRCLINLLVNFNFVLTHPSRTFRGWLWCFLLFQFTFFIRYVL